MSCFISNDNIFKNEQNALIKIQKKNRLQKALHIFYVWVSVHHTLIYIKKTNLMQSSSMFIGNCKIAVHVSAVFCVHLQEH